MSHPYKSQAKAGHAKKLTSYGGKESAKNWSGDDALNTNKQAGLDIIDEEPSLSKKTADRIMRKAGGAVKGKEAVKRLDKAPRKKGGKVSTVEWEHSKQDLEQDRKLAKKHGMTLEKFEKSSIDKKHDQKQSMEGLKKGGRKNYDRGGYPTESADLPSKESGLRASESKAEKLDRMMKDVSGDKDAYWDYRKKGGRTKRGSGGPVAPATKIYNSSENNVTKSARSGVRMGALTEAAKTTDRVKKFGGGGLTDDKAMGKRGRATNLTINIGGQGQDGQQMAMARPMAPAPAMPPAMPPAPPPMMPPMGGAPVGMPPMGAMPPMGGGMPPLGAGLPLPRKKGGRVRTTDDLTAGAGSGDGRLEKIELQQSMKGKRP